MADTTAGAKTAKAVKAPAGGDVDRVVVISTRADGTPDQSPGYEIIEH